MRYINSRRLTGVISKKWVYVLSATLEQRAGCDMTGEHQETCKTNIKYSFQDILLHYRTEILVENHISESPTSTNFWGYADALKLFSKHLF